MAFTIKDPPEFTLEVEQWNKKTKANGEQMALVIEKLLNNEVFLKRLIERLDGNAVKVGDKGTPEGVASLGVDGKLEQRINYDKIDDVPAPAWGNITGKPSNYSPSSHTHAKSEVGLGNVDNTADARKSVSYAASAGDADMVDGKHASAFAASSHTHSAATQSAAGLMSADDKKKLDGVATGANAYSHPTGNGNNHIPSGGASGQILRWSAAGTATWGSDNNTTYSAATQSAQGLMSAADKKKLDGITSGANMLKSDIVNNCTSTNTDKPLAANQGKVLMEKFNQLNSDKLNKSKLYKQLWYGEWASGTITVPEISDYKLFVVVSSSYPIAMLGVRLWDTIHCQGTDLASQWSQRNFVATFDVSGNTLKNLETSMVDLGYNNSVSTRQTFPITHIIGLL